MRGRSVNSGTFFILDSKHDILLTLLFCVGVSCLVFYDTASYPQVKGQGFGQGPAFYPRLLAGGLAILAILSYGLSRLGPDQAKITPATQQKNGGPQRRPLLPPLVCLLLCVFLFCLKWTGFVFGGFLLVATTCLSIYSPFSWRAIQVSLLAGMIVIFLVWLSFCFFIGIDLPGPWFMK